MIKILPQQFENEPVEGLSRRCVENISLQQHQLQISFEDEQFSIGKRDAVYYVRAIEEPSPTLSADPLGCEFDENGECIKAEICRVGVGENREGALPLQSIELGLAQSMLIILLEPVSLVCLKPFI